MPLNVQTVAITQISESKGLMYMQWAHQDLYNSTTFSWHAHKLENIPRFLTQLTMKNHMDRKTNDVF